MGIRILNVLNGNKTMIRLLVLTATIAFVGGLSQKVSAQDASLMIEGAKLWSDNCMRCHNARSSMERNDQDWKTIVTHMRVRANLTKSESEAIVAYIQLTNMPESVSMMSSHGDPATLTASAGGGEPQNKTAEESEESAEELAAKND